MISSKNKKVSINPVSYGNLSLDEFKARFQKGLSITECEEMHKICVSEYNKTVKVVPKKRKKEEDID